MRKHIFSTIQFLLDCGHLCCKLLSNYSVITVYSVVYCYSDSNLGYWSINITAFWKVTRLEHVNLDSVTSQSSQVTCYLEKVTYETTQPCGTQLGCCHTVCLWIGADPATAIPFRANSQSIISPSTAKFLHTIAATWLCLLKPSGDTKKNGEKTMHVWNVSVLSLSFSINVCFPSKPEINHLLPQAKFSPVTAASCLCLLKKSRNTKKNGEKPLHTFYFVALLLTIFSMKLLFSGPNPWSIISLPTGQI